MKEKQSININNFFNKIGRLKADWCPVDDDFYIELGTSEKCIFLKTDGNFYLGSYNEPHKDKEITLEQAVTAYKKYANFRNFK